MPQDRLLRRIRALAGIIAIGVSILLTSGVMERASITSSTLMPRAHRWDEIEDLAVLDCRSRLAVGFAYRCAKTLSDNDRLISHELVFHGQMILDLDHAGRILGHDFERFALGQVTDAAPQVDHTAMHHDIDDGAR